MMLKLTAPVSDEPIAMSSMVSKATDDVILIKKNGRLQLQINNLMLEEKYCWPAKMLLYNKNSTSNKKNIQYDRRSISVTSNPVCLALSSDC